MQLAKNRSFYPNGAICDLPPERAGCIFGVKRRFHVARWPMKDKRMFSFLVLWNDNSCDISFRPAMRSLGLLCGPGTVRDLSTKLAGGSPLLGP